MRKEQLLRNGRVKALIISTYVAGTVAIASQKFVTVSKSELARRMWQLMGLRFVAFVFNVEVR